MRGTQGPAGESPWGSTPASRIATAPRREDVERRRNKLVEQRDELLRER